MKQKTISKKIECDGIGLHTAKPIKMTLEPLEEDSGIIFFRSDKGVDIKVSPDNILRTDYATVLGTGSVYVSTVEHLLSVLYAYGIDNLKITLDSSEVPIMDGSAASFCLILDLAGISELSKNKKIMVIKEAVSIKRGDKFSKIFPSRVPSYDFTIRFDHPAILEQKLNFIFSKHRYIVEISRARTFGFLSDVIALRKKNLIFGASFENAVVLDDKKVLNKDGLRYKDEFVRHKILDAIGDLSILGYPIFGNYSSFAGGHALNYSLIVELLKTKSAYEIKSFESCSEKELEFSKAYA